MFLNLKHKLLYKLCIFYIDVGSFLGKQLIKENLALEEWGGSHSENIRKFVCNTSLKIILEPKK